MNEPPLRDWRGRFGVLICTNGHDRCYEGPCEGCPYCEVRSGPPNSKANDREKGDK